MKRKEKPETLSLVLAARRGCVILFCSSFRKKTSSFSFRFFYFHLGGYKGVLPASCINATGASKTSTVYIPAQTP